jgi:secondary thiamine-phosphate synthase enzyme
VCRSAHMHRLPYREGMKIMHIETQHLKEIVDLTARLNAQVKNEDMTEGMCHVFVTHTTAAVTTGEIGEGTEEDLLDVVQQMIPSIAFRHGHDPSHAWAHMASSVLGPSLSIPVSGGQLVLGTWQSVLFVELDGPRQRQVAVQLVSALP